MRGLTYRDRAVGLVCVVIPSAIAEAGIGLRFIDRVIPHADMRPVVGMRPDISIPNPRKGIENQHPGIESVFPSLTEFCLRSEDGCIVLPRNYNIGARLGRDACEFILGILRKRSICSSPHIGLINFRWSSSTIYELESENRLLTGLKIRDMDISADPWAVGLQHVLVSPFRGIGQTSGLSYAGIQFPKLSFELLPGRQLVFCISWRVDAAVSDAVFAAFAAVIAALACS